MSRRISSHSRILFLGFLLAFLFFPLYGAIGSKKNNTNDDGGDDDDDDDVCVAFWHWFCN